MRPLLLHALSIGLFLILPLWLTAAEEPAEIKGFVSDSLGHGLPYTYIALQNSSDKVICTVMTRTDGNFSIPKIPAGNYTLNLSSYGYTPLLVKVTIDKTTTDLGSFKLTQGVQIDAVEIAGERQYVSSKVDRIVYDVENDPQAAKKSAQELLSKMPFVTVDKSTGRVSIMGKNRFAITVNGKKSVLLSDANQDYVTQILKGDKLKQLELVTSPTGELANEEVVLNVTTRSSLPDMVAGQLYVDGNTRSSVMTGFGLTSKMGRFIYNLTYGYSYADTYGEKSYTHREDFNSDTYHFLESYVRNSPIAHNAHNIQFNASYDLSQRWLLTLALGAQIDDNLSRITTANTYSDPNGTTTLTNSSVSRNTSANDTYTAALNAQRSFAAKPGRLLTLQYNYNDVTSRLNFNRQASESQRSSTRNRLDNGEHTAAVDFYNPISGKQDYYITAKYICRLYGSDAFLTSATPDQRLNQLDYTQQVASLSGNYSLRLKKLMFTAMASYEYVANRIDFGEGTTLNKGMSTLQFKLRTTYLPALGHSLILNVEKNEFRPDINYLNPYRDTSVEGVISTGNADLNNEQGYHGMLIYRYFIGRKFALSFLTAGYLSNNGIFAIDRLLDDGTQVHTYDNIGKTRELRFGLTLQYNPVPWLNMNLMGAVGRMHYAYADFDNSYWKQVYSLMINATLWKGAGLSGFFYVKNPHEMLSKDIQAERMHYTFTGFATLNQQFGRHFNLSLSSYCPWTHRVKNRMENHTGDFYNLTTQYGEGRYFGARLTYTFGGFKDSVKHNARTITNSDRTKTD